MGDGRGQNPEGPGSRGDRCGLGPPSPRLAAAISGTRSPIFRLPSPSPERFRDHVLEAIPQGTLQAAAELLADVFDLDQDVGHRSKMGDGRWEMGDGRWGIGECEMFGLNAPRLATEAVTRCRTDSADLGRGPCQAQRASTPNSARRIPRPAGLAAPPEDRRQSNSVGPRGGRTRCQVS